MCLKMPPLIKAFSNFEKTSSVLRLAHRMRLTGQQLRKENKLLTNFEVFLQAIFE